jgi:hypothetical protein
MRTQILVTLNVAQQWAVSTECNSWVMLFVCTGKRLFRGIIFGELGMMDACI